MVVLVLITLQTEVEIPMPVGNNVTHCLQGNGKVR